MDKERILSKIDELDSYLLELKEIVPNTFDDYVDFKEKRRACERPLQISIETVIDICNLILKGLRLGVPGEEEDVFDKLEKSKVITKKMKKTLKSMKGLRNILVHRYGEVDDELVFQNLKHNLSDFKTFKKEILSFLKSKTS